MNFFTELKEGLAISWSAIRANKMRSILTTLGIVIGIVTVTLMGTAIEGVNHAFLKAVSFIGADVLFVQREDWSAPDTEVEWLKVQKRRHLTIEQFNALERDLTMAGALAPLAFDELPIKFEKRSASGVQIIGSNEQLLLTGGISIADGRFISAAEAEGEQEDTKTVAPDTSAKMKDSRTHLAYKAEHVVDLENELVLAAEVYPANRGDTDTLVDSVMQAKLNVDAANERVGLGGERIEEVAADKGYHAAATLELADALNLRTYIPEPKHKHRSRWTDKPEEQRRAVLNNRRRTGREKSRKLQRLRSERVERSFAHTCETGGARRSWLRGFEDVTKRYLMTVAGHNLGRVLRTLFGVGKPKALQGISGLSAGLAQVLQVLLWVHLAIGRGSRRSGGVLLRPAA